MTNFPFNERKALAAVLFVIQQLGGKINKQDVYKRQDMYHAKPLKCSLEITPTKIVEFKGKKRISKDKRSEKMCIRDSRWMWWRSYWR